MQKNIKVPEIDQVAKTLASYLTSYEFALKQSFSLSHHLESLIDKKTHCSYQKRIKKSQEISRYCFYEKDTFN